MKLEIFEPCHNNNLLNCLLFSNLSASPLLSTAKIFETIGYYD
jgi:hypothetical protein